MTSTAPTPDLRALARRIRRHVLHLHRVGPNVGSALSCTDILAALYGRVLRGEGPDDPARDRFVLSKGHAASALYAALVERGWLPREALEGYLRPGSGLLGHPLRGALPGVDVTTGSLGHGLPVACGLALAGQRAGASWRVFTLLGDGECQEGSIWEAAALAGSLHLERLAVIIDANGLQGYGRTDQILPRARIAAAFAAFGWETRQVDGHDPAAIEAALAAPAGRPLALVAHTIKGRGVRAMEDRLEWHYYSVPPADLPAFLAELEEGP